ncbi:MAG: XdhC family protein, partial [Candidatus Hadarchaeales archaeon]
IGGGESFERGLKEKALRAIKERKPTSLKFAFYGGARENELDTGLWCGGALTVFIDVIEPKPKLVLVGSGHVALPTYKIAELLGFEVTVVDDMKDTMTKERFPNAKLIYDKNFEEALKKVKVDGNTYVAIVHGEPKHDLSALRRFVRENVAYLGLLGSKTKIGKLMDILRKEGTPERILKRISGPIGLDIGAETPEEIAVSIAAELIEKIKRGREIKA